MSVSPSPTLAVAWPAFSAYQPEPRRWRSGLGCALAILLLHLLLIALCWYHPSAPVIPPKPEVIAVRWQAASTSIPKPERPSPPKPAAQPEVKPKPVPVLTKPQPRSREIKRVQPKPERKAPPKPSQAESQPVKSAVTSPSHPVAAKPVKSSPAAPEPVVAPDYQAPGLNNPALRYPPVSRRLGEEGKVRLRVLVSVQGEPQTIEIKNSSGYVRLDEAARELVRRWHFLPARRGTSTVAGWVEIPIVFKLRSR